MQNWKLYNQLPYRKEYLRLYNKSKKAKDYRREYEKTDKCKAYRKKHRQEHPEEHREDVKKYNESLGRNLYLKHERCKSHQKWFGLKRPKLSTETWNNRKVKVSRLIGKFVSWKLIGSMDNA